MIFHRIYFLDKEIHTRFLNEEERYNSNFASFDPNRLLLERSDIVIQSKYQFFRLIKCRLNEPLVRGILIQLVNETKEFENYNKRLEKIVETKIKFEKPFENTIIENFNNIVSQTYSRYNYVVIRKTAKDSLV